MNEFSLSSGISNRVGKNEFFLTLDYDTQDLESIKKEIIKIQQDFNLSEVSLYKTNKGIHAYFFYDNNLSKENILNIFKSLKLIDTDFIENFIFFSEKGKGVTLRLNGKYKDRDIFFSEKLEGRKPSFLEKTTGDSLKSIVESQINNPLLNNNNYIYEIDSIEPGNEKKVPKEAVVVHNNKETLIDNTKKSSESVPREGAFVKDRKIKISINEIWPKNKEITEARKKWYSNPFIARLISSALDLREGAFVKDRKINNQLLELGKKEGVKYSVNNFADIRPFFLKNTKNIDDMNLVFSYNIEKSGFVENPMAFFKSVAKYDFKNPNLQDKRKGVHLFDFSGRKELQNYLNKEKLSLITGFDIIFDFDSEDGNSTESYDNAKKMRDLLNDMKIPFSLNFSGSKGFHIRINSDILNKFVPEFIDFIKKDENNIKNIFEKLKNFAKVNNIKIDPGVYSGDLRCLIRVEWSIHQSTGSVVKPLTDKEFDELNGKTLFQIQEMYKVNNLLSGNKDLGIKKFNPQKKDFITKMEIDGNYMSWEEMRDSGLYNNIESNGKTEWEVFRADYINPINKELRKISKEDPKQFADILKEGEYLGFKVYASEYIDLLTGRNFDYHRIGDSEALREFVLNLIK